MSYVIHFAEGWMWFCIASGAALFLTLLMGRYAARLVTRDGSLRGVTVLDLEFPSNTLDIPNIINGIYRLPDEAQQKRVLAALKRVLYLDFLFMPAIYSAIFILCMQVASNESTGSIAQVFFMALGWLQAIAWLFDVLENIYLLGCVHPDLKSSDRNVHRIYVAIVLMKWAIALIGGVSALMMVLYFWLKGGVKENSLYWMGVYFVEIVLFVLAALFFSPKKESANFARKAS